MHASLKQLEEGLGDIRLSPKDIGTVELIVCRPSLGERIELDEAELDLEQGLVGDNWLARGFRKYKGGLSHPDMQLNSMNSRSIALIAQTKDRWKLAGDQFYVDLDLSDENLPPGTTLSIGEALIQITAEPHLGCSKFMEPFGRDAVLYVNSEIGKSLNLRGVNAKVLKAGKVSAGELIKKIAE